MTPWPEVSVVELPPSGPTRFSSNPLIGARSAAVKFGALKPSNVFVTFALVAPVASTTRKLAPVTLPLLSFCNVTVSTQPAASSLLPSETRLTHSRIRST